MIGTEACHRLHNRACFPDGAIPILRQNPRAKVAELGIFGISELALSRSRFVGTASTPTGIKHGSITGCAPWIELGPVLLGARLDIAVEGTVFRVVDCRLHAASTAVFSVGIYRPL